MTEEMRKRPIGNSGMEASVVGLGTWAIGGWKWGGTDEARSIDAIRASIDEGITLIDTAPAYGMGRSEEIVGRAIKGRRDEVVLATKCGLVWHTREGNHFFDQQDKPVHRYLGRASIIHELEQSLKRLGTDHIDLYITHWQDPTTPIDETMEALEKLRADGKIRAIGASNTGLADLKAYVAAGRLDAIQEEFSMLHRKAEDELLPFCGDNSISMLGYSSLALGLLSGRIGPDREFSGDDLRRENPRFSTGNRAKVARLMAEIGPVCERHSATPAQIIIAWTLVQPGITFSLCGARNADQARENAKAGRITLSQEDLAAIDTAAASHLTDLDG